MQKTAPRNKVEKRGIWGTLIVTLFMSSCKVKTHHLSIHIRRGAFIVSGKERESIRKMKYRPLIFHTGTSIN